MTWSVGARVRVNPGMSPGGWVTGTVMGVNTRKRPGIEVRLDDLVNGMMSCYATHGELVAISTPNDCPDTSHEHVLNDDSDSREGPSGIIGVSCANGHRVVIARVDLVADHRLPLVERQYVTCSRCKRPLEWKVWV